jgi:hypothetical protein
MCESRVTVTKLMGGKHECARHRSADTRDAGLAKGGHSDDGAGVRRAAEVVSGMVLIQSAHPDARALHVLPAAEPEAEGNG